MSTPTATTDELTRIALEGHTAITAAVTTWVELAERYAKNFDAKHPLPAAADIERMGAARTVLAEFAPRGRAAAAYEALWADVRARVGPRP